MHGAGGNIMGKLKLGHKIGGGFALILILTLIVSAVSWQGLANVEKSVNRVTEMGGRGTAHVCGQDAGPLLHTEKR